MHEHAETKPVLALMGLRCAGKTSVGRALAARLGVEFVDLDAAIAARTGGERGPGVLLAELGEEAFRALEAETLRELLDAHPVCVLALGGGTLERPDNRVAVGQHALCVLLDAPDVTLAERLALTRDERPPLEPDESALAEVRRLRERRAVHFATHAALVLNSARAEPDELAADLAERLEFAEGAGFCVRA